MLISLFKGALVPYEDLMGDRKEIYTKLDGWNYIESNGDIEFLMNSYGGFHDSVLVSLNYISGSKCVGKWMKVSDEIRRVSMTFDGYKKSLELVFEGTVLLNLRPADEGSVNILGCATITLEDHIISFFDGDVVGNPEEYEYTWIKAYGLRWRFIDEGSTT